MAIQFINTGTAPNQGNGDTLRAAFTKINDNFAQIVAIEHSEINASIVNTSTQVGIVVHVNTATNSMSFIVDTVSTTTAKTLTLASTSTSSAQSDGAGIIVHGPTVPATFLYTAFDDSWSINKQLNTPEVSNPNNEIRVVGNSTSSGIIADFGMYDGTGGAWNSRAVITQAGNINATNFQASSLISGLNVSSTDILFQGDSYDGVLWSNTSLRTDGNVDGYRQFVMKNHSTGTHASSDLVIGGDQGDELNNYVDIGFNGSQYLDPTYGIYTANSGYVFTNGGPLYLGTQTPGSRLYFHAGGTQPSNAGGFLDDYAWNFNRSVQVVVGTPSALNFTVQNINPDQGATAVYQAINNNGSGIIMGVNSSNTVDGQIQPGDAFIRTIGSTGTSALHIGNQRPIYFYADTVLGNQGPPVFSLFHNGVYTQAVMDGNFVPSEDANYDLGSTTATWKSIYLSTGTIYMGNIAVEMNTSTRQLVVDGVPIGASTATGITYTPATPANWVGSPTVGTVSAGLDELASRVSLINITTSTLVNGSNSLILGQTGNVTFPNGGSLRVSLAPVSSKGQIGDIAGLLAVNTSSIFYCIADYVALPNSATANVSGGDGVNSGIAASLSVVPSVGWTIEYNGQSSTINQVVQQGGWYIIFWDNVINVPTGATFRYGPDPLPNIWVKQNWSTTGSW